MPVRRWWLRGAALIAAGTLAACASTGGGGARPARQLKIAVTETGYENMTRDAFAAAS